jgi:hypothetical protein
LLPPEPLAVARRQLLGCNNARHVQPPVLVQRAAVREGLATAILRADVRPLPAVRALVLGEVVAAKEELAAALVRTRKRARPDICARTRVWERARGRIRGVP